jgi:translation initiation factor 1
MSEYSRLVYSTGQGQAPEKARTPPSRRGSQPAPPRPRVPDDGVVRVHRDRGGRKGKTVTLVTGVPAQARAEVAARLKRALGTGGGVQDGVVEIQGDHREAIAARLDEMGYKVKIAGG